MAMSPSGAAQIINITAGALVAAGGVMGFVKKSSKPSLIAGLAFGALYFASAYLIHGGAMTKEGLGVGAGAGTALVAAMLPRFIKTGAFMPSGMCAVLGLGTMAYNGFHYNKLAGMK